MVADAIRFVSAGTGGGTGLFYVHADHLGTPQKMTDGNQALVWDAVLKPFGETQSITGTASNNQRFPGQYADAETGFSYNYFRDYDPSTGRYVESDPIGTNGGLNIYGYVDQNPIISTDPSGLFPIFFFEKDDIDAMFFLFNVPPRVPKMYACNARCPTEPVVCPAPSCPPWLPGYGVANNLPAAKKAARKDANSKVPAGCKLKHCTYACRGPKGDPIYPKRD